MSGVNQFNQTWGNPHLPATNDIPATSHPLTSQQPGAPTHYQPRNVDNMTSIPHGQIHPPQLSPTSLSHLKASHLSGNANHDHIRGHQPSVVSPTLHHPTEDPTRSRIEYHTPTSDHQQWVLDGGSTRGHLPPSSGQPPTYHTISAHAHGRRPTNDPPDASPKKCRIPDCTYNAYYDVSEQELTEYCGQGHELQAISTGLVASCVMCRGRPRRTGERVCGRTCREQESQARQVQGSYYGSPVVRREHRARPGA